MSEDRDIKAEAVEAAAGLFGVALQPEWREAAVMNFGTLAAAAGLVMGFPLDDDAEYGPVFTP